MRERAHRRLLLACVVMAVVVCVAPAIIGVDAIEIALSQLGKPYELGKEGPNAFDCSGLVRYSYDQVGVRLSNTQGGSGTQNLVSNTTRVSGPSSLTALLNSGLLRRGDLLFFSIEMNDTVDHVGLFVEGTSMVHAPEPNQVVKRTDTLAVGRVGSRGAVGRIRIETSGLDREVYCE